MTLRDPEAEPVSSPLPTFSHPPVVEVGISVGFEPIDGLHPGHWGLLWKQAFADFPVVEERAPFQPVIERFGATATLRPEIQVEMANRPPSPRIWFVNRNGTELVQLQRNWFARNWRKVLGTEEYPRYERLIEPFKADLGRFVEFLASEELGELVPVQCEVTYVNHIEGLGVWSEHGELHKVLELVSPQHEVGFLTDPENLRLAVQYLIPGDDGEPVGRLHVGVEPAFKRDSREPIFVMTLTARGTPESSGLEGVYRFLDRGHNWIVLGFEAITSDDMHRAWGKQSD